MCLNSAADMLIVNLIVLGKAFLVLWCEYYIL
jgi:hypothetical protein